MSGTVDSRVVSMKFDNADFANKVGPTLSLLEKLKQKLNLNGAEKGLGKVETGAGRLANALRLPGATKGLNDVASASNKVRLDAVGGAVQGLSAKFVAMSTIAITALSQITSAALHAGTQITKSLSLGPAMDGFHEYETNMNSIQTILANTGLKGQAGLDKVTGALNELNTYSDKTIYSFSEMARNIGTFTSAGVNLKTSTAAIKGIANLAAVSGSSSEQASTAMYQLSQAMASGTVKLMDWNSVVNAGMGGKVFQEALKDTARAHGVAVDDIIKKNGSFRESLQEGWLTSSVLTDTLSKFTGDLSLAQIKAMGYTDQQAKQILEMGQTAQDAATKIKTMSQLVGSLKEAMGSGWSQTWQILFGDFGEARTLFTDVSNTLGGMISASAKARNKLLGDWKAMGGRTWLIQGISNAFHALIAIVKPIREAFRDIFPKKTAADLFNITLEFAHLMAQMKPSAETAKNLKNIFHGVFAVFDIVKQVIVGVVKGLFSLFSAAGSGGGGFLKFLGSIGAAVYNFDLFLKRTGAIEKFFTSLSGFLALPIMLLKDLAGRIGDLFSKFNPKGSKDVNDSLDAFQNRVAPVKRGVDAITRFFDKLGQVFSNLGKKVGEGISHLGAAIANSLGGDAFGGILSAINTGLFAGLIVLLKKFVKDGVSVNADIGGGMFAQVKETLEGVNGTLKAMQTQLKAKALLEIAGALALLTVSIVALSMIDPKKLAVALVAIGVAFIGLNKALESLSNIGVMASLKLPLITGSLIALSGAIVLMALALKIMASIKPEDTARALMTLGVTLLFITKAMQALSKDPAGMIRAGAAMILLGVGLNAIAVALKIFATLSWGEMAHGLVAMAGALLVIIAAMQLMPKNMILQAAALDLLAIALNAIGVALKVFASLSWKEMARGLVALAGALLIIAGAMTVMPSNMLLQAAALIAVGVALNAIAAAVKIMGSMGWGEIAKGMVVLAGSMLILAIGLTAMSGALPGAAALLVAAAALAILTPVLVTLGSLSWETIGKGLLTLAGIFVIFGAAGYLLAPVVPVLLGLGVAMVLLGAGLALAGVGALAFGAAFGLVVGALSGLVNIVNANMSAFANTIVLALKSAGQGIVAFAGAIAQGGPQFFAAMNTILSTILMSIIVNTPRIGQAFLALITTALRVLVVAVPRIAAAGLALLVGILTAISNNIYRIVAVVANLIKNFLKALGDKLPGVIQAGVDFIIKFINGLADAIDKNSGPLGDAGGKLAVAIIKGMVNGLIHGQSAITDAAKNAAKSALHGAMHMLGINSPSKEFHKLGMYSSQGLANGIEAYSGVAEKSARQMAKNTLASLKDSMSNVGDLVTADMDTNPVIAPVIDLTQFRKDAAQMAGLVATPPVTASVSYEQASTISADQQAARDAEAAAPPSSTESVVLKLEQKNYSPEPLSTATIYRQTNNLMAQAKKALDEQKAG